MREFLTAQRRDGAADAEAVQDQVEALAGVDALVKGNVARAAAVLFFGRLGAFQRLRHRLGFAEHAEVDPGLRDVALVEVQLPDQPARPGGWRPRRARGPPRAGPATGRSGWARRPVRAVS